MLSSLPVEKLRNEFKNAQPFPHLMIESFLTGEYATNLAAAYPSYDDAVRMGRQFQALHEKKKVQVTDCTLFPPPVKSLHELLASDSFVQTLSEITGIPNLLADPKLNGGGMHMTGPRGRLDVHVDFNYVDEHAWHRRLNLLLYLNPVWEESWGGGVELWDKSVTHRHHVFAPILNRCVIFETSDISYHGVEPVTCPEHVVRKSFATYYYTKEPPAGWDGKVHSTLFRDRPTEPLRKFLLGPITRAKDVVESGYLQLRKKAREIKNGRRS